MSTELPQEMGIMTKYQTEVTELKNTVAELKH